MIQINPREVAAEAMVQILAEGAYNNTALRRLLRQNGAMSQQDRAFVTEIVNGTLRNIYYVDYVIDQFSNTKLSKIKPWLLAVLRTAVYQMLFMDVPDNAACNEAVKLATARGYQTLSGFVNGVLRAIGRGKAEIKLPEKGTAEYLSVVYSHPLWLVKMWVAYYGYEKTEALCQADNEAPDVTIRVNTLKTDAETLAKQLKEKGITVRQGSLWKDALHLSRTADLGRLAEFQEGLFHVQDESSQTAVAVLDPQKGEKILDLCAAPGGKTFTMAEHMENSGEIHAGDIYEHKAELIADGAQRLGISIVKTSVRDASVEDASAIGAYDRVLADVPCSGLGLLRKKPDIRLKKDGSEIDALVGIQRQILEQAAKYVKDGGVLVYSTCTLSRKENEKNVEWFLQNHESYRLEDLGQYLPESLAAEGEKGYITLFPQSHHTDGFFIARLRKKGM